MTPVGICLVGAGPWGMTLARTLARVGEIELRWICELEDERRARAGSSHPQARLTHTLDDALSDPGVMAAVVAVDSPRHYGVGLRVIEADRHLLVEKPLAMSNADASALCAAAEARTRVLMVGHLLLHHPAIRRARQLIADGALGDLLYFESTRATPGPGRIGDDVWWTLAPHDVSLAIALMGAAPTSVSATAGTRPASDQPHVAFASLQFSDGRVAHIHVGRLAAEKQRRFSLSGTRRALTFDELNAGGTLRLHEPERIAAAAGEVVPIDAVDPLLAQCLHFASCVSRSFVGGGNGEHARSVVRVLEAGARSMRADGAPIEVS